jgi:Ca2+-binding EF-hand superfamily protein
VPDDFERDLSVTIQFFLVEEIIEFSVVVAQVTYKEIEEMIRTVDRNGDGRISYSEFRLA